MAGPDGDRRTAFLIGVDEGLAAALEARGLRVLGHIRTVDLFLPLAPHCRADVVVIGEEGAGPELAESVARVRILSPAASVAVLARDGGADLPRAGATHVFRPPFDPDEVAATLAGTGGAAPGATGVAHRPETGAPAACEGAGRAGAAAAPRRPNGRPGAWTPAEPSDPPAPGRDEPALAFLREAAWRARGEPHPPAPPPEGTAGARQPREVVAVLGARGGVGRTFLAANLASVVALHAPGRVLLIDLSGWGDAAAHLDLAPGPSLIDLLPHLSSLDRRTFEEHRRVDGRSGLQVLVGAPRPELDDLVTAGHVEHLLAWAEREHGFTFAIGPSRPGDERLLPCARRATRLVLVATPEAPALRQARLLLDWLERRDVAWRQRLHLVLNRVRGDSPLSPAEVERLTGLRPVAALPEDHRAVEQSILAGRTLALSQPGHPLARGVWHLACLFVPALPAAAPGAPGRPRWLARLRLTRREAWS